MKLTIENAERLGAAGIGVVAESTLEFLALLANSQGHTGLATFLAGLSGRVYWAAPTRDGDTTDAGPFVEFRFHDGTTDPRAVDHTITVGTDGIPRGSNIHAVS